MMGHPVNIEFQSLRVNGETKARRKGEGEDRLRDLRQGGDLQVAAQDSHDEAHRGDAVQMRGPRLREGVPHQKQSQKVSWMNERTFKKTYSVTHHVVPLVLLT